MQSDDRKASTGTGASVMAKQDEEVDEDWLNASDDEQCAGHDDRMISRESGKVQKVMYDQGYREGIIAGKEAQIQKSFDKGFDAVGAPLGRRAGRLSGRLYAAKILLRKREEVSTPDYALRERLSDINVRCLRDLKLDRLSKPDHEALEHEREHGQDSSAINHHETEDEKTQREMRLDVLESDLDKFFEEIRMTK